MKIRVSIIEDDIQLRQHLTALISGASEFVCAGSHGSAEAALKAIPCEKPEVILLDLGLPGMGGREFILELNVRHIAAEILVLTVDDGPKTLFEALEAGASGYLVKPPHPARLLEAIAEVHAGGSPMSSQIARLIIQHFRHRGRTKRELEQLTRREEEVLQLLSRGCLPQDVADQLGISVRTIGTHLNGIYRKLHVQSRAQAVAKYLQS